MKQQQVQDPQKQQQKSTKSAKFSNAISLLQKRHYGCLSKIFCCKCFYCCQDFDFTLLTSKKRKGVFEQMVKNYLKSNHKSNDNSSGNIIMDPFFILVALMLGQQSEIYAQLMQQVSNNGNNDRTIFSKEDLQYYIPELCTYLVFHEEMNNAELTTLLQRACKIDLHFSLRYYFFMRSLEIIENNFQTKKLPIVEKYNTLFRNKINITHKVRTVAESISIKRKKKNLTKLQRKSSFRQAADSACQKSKITAETQKQFDKPSPNTNELRFSQTSEVGTTKNEKGRYSLDSKSQQPKNVRKYSNSSLQNQIPEQQLNQMNTEYFKICHKYNTVDQYLLVGETMSLQLQKIPFLYPEQVYSAFICKDKQNYPTGLFESTASFYFDLVALSELLIRVDNRNEVFADCLKQINMKLPSSIYIPFSKGTCFVILCLAEYQDLNIVNILVSECRVFKTKQRAPFKISFEAFYSPSESQQSKRQKKIRSTQSSSKLKMKRSMLFEQDIMLDIQGQENENDKNEKRNSLSNTNDQHIPSNNSSIENQSMDDKNFNLRGSYSKSIQKIEEKDLRQSANVTALEAGRNLDFRSIKKSIWDKMFQLKNRAKQLIVEHPAQQAMSRSQKQSELKTPRKMEEESNFSENISQLQGKSRDTKTMIESDIFDMNYQESEQDIEDQINLFGESAEQKKIRISQRSPYSQLPGYKLINFMVKSNDDLRQECFAMQLLQEFQRIFKMQKLKIKLCPYEVLPLTHNSGIIEFLDDAITIDELIKKHGNLHFVRKSKQKMKNFLSSLVGYSLINYFLQVKDRHNANIMIKRDGTLIHIDYGFIISSAPGKGVELEANVPFKLTTEYIEALGGLKSKHFSEFRILFYKGFNAIRKHQHRVIILAKLMYSSYGTTMKCFQKGDQAIQKFVGRFNPSSVHTDGQLSLFCQSLVNSSIQNWRARWYDRWQYFAQGILY